MNRTALVSLGILFTVMASMLGLILLPEHQLAGVGPTKVTQTDGTEAIYPQPLDDYREAPGREVYRSLGCMYCHSQQVRPEGFGADLDRGWGARRSVPRDYALQDPPLLGTMRTGPDLSNIGQRQPSEDWHYLHLYNPQITSEGSNMPPFPFLFEVVTQAEAPSDEAVALPASSSNGSNGTKTWIVPSEDARDLVGYLKSLEQPYPLEAVR